MEIVGIKLIEHHFNLVIKLRDKYFCDRADEFDHLWTDLGKDLQEIMMIHVTHSTILHTSVQSCTDDVTNVGPHVHMSEPIK